MHLRIVLGLELGVGLPFVESRVSVRVRIGLGLGLRSVLVESRCRFRLRVRIPFWIRIECI